MKIRAIIAAITILLVFPVLSAAGNVILVCNPSAQISMLNKKDVGNIFLGKQTTWKNGDKIDFAIQKNSSLHENFVKEFVHKTPFQYANYWQKQIFTGKGSALKSFGDDQEMIKFISETKGAIGYVSDGVDLKNVNVKSIDIK